MLQNAQGRIHDTRKALSLDRGDIRLIAELSVTVTHLRVSYSRWSR